MTILAMDSIDRSIIAYLAGNARASTSDIARTLGIARTTVHERMARLERSGTIAGYTVLLTRNPFENYVRGYLMFDIDKALTGHIVDVLKRFPEVKSCDAVVGEANLICLCEAPQLEDIDVLISELSAERGVHAVRSAIVLSSRIDRNGVFTAGRPASGTLGIGRGEAG